MELFEINNKNVHKSEGCKLEAPVVDKLSYAEFFENYIVSNQPCLIKNVSTNWKSTKLWTKNNKINFDILYKKYGQRLVTIYDCNSKFYNSQKTQEMCLQKYLVYWEAFAKSKYNTEMFDVLYLKDWHLINEDGPDEIYDVPNYFASDWLNEFLVENSRDDYRFVYMGPKNTWTPFHTDVFSSFSWSANIIGTKRWILYPPNTFDRLPYTIEKPEGDYIEIIQNSGEAVFVPSGWAHQVWNLTDCISINHNWINGANLNYFWTDLVKNNEMVKVELSDCKDDEWVDQVQLVLKANYGVDFVGYFEFLEYMALRRLGNSGRFGKNHVEYDLTAIKHGLNEFIKNEDVCNLIEKYATLKSRVEVLLKKLENV